MSSMQKIDRISEPHMTSPTSIHELLTRAIDLAGLTLAELANELQHPIPEDFSRDKGWSGILLEQALGATAGSRPEPDFPHLGVEMKTLPISAQGVPLETTFVCVAPMVNLAGESWETSAFRKKLAQVLWVPLLAERSMSPAERQIGTPFLWQATPAQENALKQDWEELMELLALGQIHKINAHMGEYLQLRPKAAHGQITTDVIGSKGQTIQAQPKGFYLRTQFTKWVLNQQFAPN